MAPNGYLGHNWMTSTLLMTQHFFPKTSNKCKRRPTSSLGLKPWTYYTQREEQNPQGQQQQHGFLRTRGSGKLHLGSVVDKWGGKEEDVIGKKGKGSFPSPEESLGIF